MAFEAITHSEWFKRMSKHPTGLLVVAHAKRVVFKTLFHMIDDVKWNKIQYKKYKGCELNLENPKTFSEKVLFMKLFYRNPLMHLCADKHYAGEYIKACGFPEIVLPKYGVYANLDDIDFTALPNKFFIKCNHSSNGFNAVVKKDNINKKFLKKCCRENMKLNYYWVSREYAYDKVEPKILCEPCLESKDGKPLVDYKFYCFDGKLKYYMVSYGELAHESKNHKFDANDHSIDSKFKQFPTVDADDILLPENIEQMKQISEKLSKPFPHVRVDLYNIDGKIYFGEFTFYSNGGSINVYDREMDEEIGSWIDLPKYKADMVIPPKYKKYRKALEV